MTERKEEKKQELRAFDWKSMPNAPQIYSNYLYMGWSLDDVRITFGALRAENVSTKSHFSEEQGSVVLPWRQAKNLRDMLTRVIAAYEEVNGEIRNPFLPETDDKKSEKPQ
jgi:Protein of unknown function (DUF3467)